MSVSVTPPSPASGNASEGAPFSSAPFTASGGSGQYVWEAVGTPDGIGLLGTLGTAQVLTGIPTVSSASGQLTSYVVTVVVTDANDNTDHASCTYQINIGPFPLPNAVPATPLADTPTQSPLVSVGDYRFVTGDDSSLSDDIETAVAKAVQLCSSRCKRTFQFGHYQEILYVYKAGMAYPSATPITQVDAPTEADIQGAGVWVGWFFPVPELPVWTGVVPPQTIVTYWGGYTEATAPELLRRCIAKVAWFQLNPVTLPGRPGGATSTSVAGISIAGDISSMVLMDRQLGKDLDRFKRRQGHSWQS